MSQHLVVISSIFPTVANPYSGTFVFTRVSEYRQRIFKVTLLLVRRNPNVDLFLDKHIDNVMCSHENLGKKITSLDPDGIFCHSPDTHTLKHLLQTGHIFQTSIWFHGFEVRSPMRLDYNFGKTRESQIDKFQAINAFLTRKAILKEIFSYQKIRKIFVSNYLKSIAEYDVCSPCINTQIIPNPVDTTKFRFSKNFNPKNVLFVRPFTALNYGIDLMENIIQGYNQQYQNNRINFRVFGHGRYFAKYTSKIDSFVNVQVSRKFLSTEEIISLQNQCGTQLIPTRFDTQGISMCEAMSAGLFVITNNVCAIPEYSNSKSVFLCESENVDQMISTLRQIELDPNQFIEKRKLARKLVQEKCDKNLVIEKEISLM